jgi:single-strand DNA-binding protein
VWKPRVSLDCFVTIAPLPSRHEHCFAGREPRDAGADFVWITAWERQAELCAEYLGKGHRVAVEGRLKSRTWEQDGRRRDAIEIVARRIDFLGGPKQDEDDELAEVVPFEPAVL